MNDPFKYKLDNASIFAFVIAVIAMCIISKIFFGSSLDFSALDCILVFEAIVVIIATLFGASAGLLTGFLGVISSMDLCGTTISFSAAIAMALLGVYVGWFANKYGVREGKLSIKEMLFWIVIHASALIAAFVFVQPFIDYVVYDKDLFDGVRRGFIVTGIGTFASGLIIVSFLFLYSKIHIFLDTKKSQ